MYNSVMTSLSRPPDPHDERRRDVVQAAGEAALLERVVNVEVGPSDTLIAELRAEAE